MQKHTFFSNIGSGPRIDAGSLAAFEKPIRDAAVATSIAALLLSRLAGRPEHVLEAIKGDVDCRERFTMGIATIVINVLGNVFRDDEAARRSTINYLHECLLELDLELGRRLKGEKQ